MKDLYIRQGNTEEIYFDILPDTVKDNIEINDEPEDVILSRCPNCHETCTNDNPCWCCRNNTEWYV